MLAFVGRVLGGTLKLGVKYVVVPVLIGVATAMIAEKIADRMRERTAEVDAKLAMEKIEKAEGRMERPPRPMAV